MKILLLLLFPLAINCQTFIEGTIINKTTKQGIPYATVGLINENRGTNANEDGTFRLTIRKNSTDTIIISSAGYETTKFPADNLPTNFQFEIAEKKIQLSDIVLKSSFSSSYTLNDYANCGFNSYTSSGSITQVAQHLQSPIANSLLSELYICKEGDNSIFRIRVYDMDPVTGKPSNELADTIIEVRSGKRHVQVNLEKYHIIIPGKDFFVGIEWLYIPSNESKVKVKSNGQKFRLSQYSPFLFFKNRKSNSDMLEAWQLDYRRKWVSMTGNWTFLISAKVKY